MDDIKIIKRGKRSFVLRASNQESALISKIIMALSSPSEATSIYLPFAHRMASELNVVSIDHSYAKPWSTHPEASNAQPARLLFMDPLPRQATSDKARDEMEIVDVEIQDKPVMPDYDLANARSMMSECERHAILLRPDFAEYKDDWEEHIATLRTTWSVLQNRVFAKVMRVLQSDRLARLTIQETANEPIQRRLQIDKAAKRVKFAFANVNWDMTLILWMHNIFLENLRGQLLTSYLEILQTLRVKIPSLIEKLIEGTECKPGGLSRESLNVLLNRTWDPVLSSINQQKPKKLPGQSVLLVIANVPSMANSPLATKRHKFWQHQLSSMGKVINIVPVNNSSAIPIANCVENMVASTRSKILEVKGHFPGRPIVLVGFHIGSLVACQVALMEQVQAIVCLGYPTMGVHGNRGEIEDLVYNYKTPILFVVGQHASSCSTDALEDIREKLRVDSGLIVVGGADDHLRMARAKKKNCGVTQSVVDRCVIDEVSNFLGNTLQVEASSSDSLDDVDIVKKASRKRKKMALAVAVGSQTSGDLVNQVRMEKKSAKALKSLKQDPMLSSVSAAMDGKLSAAVPSSIKQTMPKLTKTGKRASPKKSLKSSDGETPAKRPLMQANFKSKKSQLSTRNEAAAIASAPELSNLLQSSLPRYPPGQLQTASPSTTTSSSSTTVSTLSSPFIPSSAQTTTAQALSKLLQSSDINMMLSSSPSTLSCLDNAGVKNTPAIVSHHSTAAANTLPDSNVPKKPEATQILIHTRDSPNPISFPVTFTMASKVMKTPTAATMKSAVSAAATCHSVPSFSLDSNRPKLSQTAAQQQIASVLQVGGQSLSSSALSSMLQSAAASSAAANNSTTPSHMKDNSTTFPTPLKSPLASVINMGSDTVHMKETPSSASDPGTVSIDLGQLSTSSNIVMKFGNSSKISLMPTLKPLSSSSSSSLLGSGHKSGLDVSSLLTQAKNTLASTSTLSMTTAVETKPASAPVHSTGKPMEKNLTILSSSDLLSSLSSNSGLITLKLSTPSSSSTGITLTPQRATVDRNEGREGVLKVLPMEKLTGVSTMPKNVTAMTFTPSSTVSINTAKVVSKPILSQHLHNRATHKEQTGTASDHKSMPTSMSVIFATAASKQSTASSALSSLPTRFTLQSPATSSITGTPSTSYKTVLVSSKSSSGNVETLGKVTSLLESSPVTVDQPKTLSLPTAADYNTPTKDVVGPDSCSMKTIAKSVASSSSSSSPSLLPSSPTTPVSQPRASKSTVSSYTPTTKSVLPTVASTRTRRIKTPKQYDL